MFIIESAPSLLLFLPALAGLILIGFSLHKIGSSLIEGLMSFIFGVIFVAITVWFYLFVIGKITF